MGLLDLFRTKPNNTAAVAKDRLRIIIAQERGMGGRDFLPLLRKELLEVITKYVNVDAEAVKVNVVKEDERDILDISIALPD